MNIRTLAFLAFVFLSFCNAKSQDMETLRKMSGIAQRKALLNLSFEEWQTIYVWKNNFGYDLKKYGFELYSKYTQSGKRYGIIKLPNDTITKADFELVNGAFAGGVMVANNNKLGMIDSSGKLVIPTEYDEILSFINGRGFVMKNRKYAAVTYSGKILTAFNFDKVAMFSDNAAEVMVNNRVGYIDDNGKYISQPIYNDGTFFFNGFAKVYYDKWETVLKNQQLTDPRKPNVSVGYTKSIPFLINKKGNKIFSGESLDYFSVSLNSYATVGRNHYIDGSKYYFECVIDTTGKIILPFERKLQTIDFTNDWIIVTNPISGYSGVIGYSGNTMLPTSFYKVEALQYKDKSLGRVYFDKDNFYYVDKNCNCVEFEDVKCPEKN